MTVSKARVLVTGGAGYIGSHCCKALFDAGYEPICYDNLSTGHSAFVRWGPLIKGDILDSIKLTKVFESYNIHAVLHFAGLSSVAESVCDPNKYYRNNLVGTIALLEAMCHGGCLNLVFSSSGAVYGSADSKSIPETFRCSPINPYGATKWMIERLLLDYHAAYGFSSVCLRYFNASGADLSGLIGELRDQETHLIPRALMSTLGQTPALEVYGDDYETPDGTAVRDYIHVSDLAAAHVLALEKVLAGHPGGSLNLGTGTGFSVKEILAAIELTTGRRVPYTIQRRRAGDPAILVANPSQAAAELNFRPRHSDLATIIGTAWAWQQKVGQPDPGGFLGRYGKATIET